MSKFVKEEYLWNKDIGALRQVSEHEKGMIKKYSFCKQNEPSVSPFHGLVVKVRPLVPRID